MGVEDGSNAIARVPRDFVLLSSFCPSLWRIWGALWTLAGLLMLQNTEKSDCNSFPGCNHETEVTIASLSNLGTILAIALLLSLHLIH